MYHRQEIAVNNTTGVPIAGVHVRLYDASDNLVSIYADSAGTPIISASGIADTAVSDDAGNYSYYVANGVYTERLYVGDALAYSIPSVVMQGLVTTIQTPTFAGAATIATSSDTNLVIVSGTSAVGDSGTGRQFAYDATVDAAYVAANPTTSFVDATGRGFKEIPGADAASIAAELALKVATADLASTAAGKGAELVGFLQSGTGAVARTAQAKMRDVVSVKDFGAVGDGATDDTAAINAMLAVGGFMRLNGPATYKVTGRLLMTQANSKLRFEAGVTITGNPWTYPGSQTPFGSMILVTGNNCSVVGAGRGSSVIQITGGSQANGVTFLHVDGGYAADFTVDGGMAAGAAIADDTFQTGVAVFNDSAARPTATASKVLIERVEMRNWLQYGGQSWGNLAMTDFVDCWSHDNGKVGDALSVGSGIALTNGSSNVSVRGCTIHNNKTDGIFQSSAGVAASDIKIIGNAIYDNGNYGFSCQEDTNYSSIAGVGTSNVALSGNVIDRNTAGNVRFGTFSNVGIIKNVSSVGDLITNSAGYGFLIQTNAGPTTSRFDIDSIITGNATGLAAGADIDATVHWDASKIRGNTTDISNNGTSTLISNARGVGTTIASAATITPPADGDVFVLTGTTTVTSIAPDPGRTITLIFGGNITVAHTGGNIVMGTSDFVGTANASTLQLTCFGASWFKIAGSVN